MKEIKPAFKNSFDGYYMAQSPDGVLRCSCGRKLIKLDEHTWQCSGGYPIYRDEDGAFVLDKFGNLMLKAKDHDAAAKKEAKFFNEFKDNEDCDGNPIG